MKYIYSLIDLTMNIRMINFIKYFTVGAFCLAIFLLISCSKNTSGIKGTVMIKESNTNSMLVADDVTVFLYSADNPNPERTVTSDVNGEFSFPKLPKKDNWKVSSSTKLNGITYQSTLTEINTDGKSVTNVKLILEN